MDIEYFHEFSVLAMTGNYLAAADKLHLSQSTLSRHIQAFEKELGVSVFNRNTRRIELSQYGEAMLPFAQSIVNWQAEYTSVLFNLKRRERNNLQISSLPMMVSYGITDILTEFHKEYPEITLDVHEADILQQMNMLESGECDFAFIRSIEHCSKPLNSIPFSHDAMVALIPLNHPLGKEKNITIKQLENVPLLFLAEDTFMYKLCIAQCREAGFDPIVAFTSHHAHNLIDFARKGQGVALLMEKPILKYDLRGLNIADVVPAIETEIALVSLPELQMTGAPGLFAEFVRKNCQDDFESK